MNPSLSNHEQKESAEGKSLLETHFTSKTGHSFQTIWGLTMNGIFYSLSFC